MQGKKYKLISKRGSGKKAGTCFEIQPARLLFLFLSGATFSFIHLPMLRFLLFLPQHKYYCEHEQLQ
jgi:hypothetical protein